MVVGTVSPSAGLIVRTQLCSQEILAVLGQCPSADNDGVTLTGTQTQQTDATDPVPGGWNPSDESPYGSEPNGAPAPPPPISQTCRDDVHENQSCLGGIRVDEVVALPADPAAPPAPGTPARTITLSDVARFVPSSTTIAGEPDNIAVVGLPANFLSSAKTETIPGTILGRTLTIRFTPVGYAFDYGDGEQRTTTTAGTSWKDAGQAQFTPTDTSHVYTQPGTFTATVVTSYTAEIDLGAGWIPIAGTLTGPAASQQIRVVKAHTALVQNTCTERPGAPGC
ncbi:MAG: hypothetical protein JSS74_16995 [Actinobacteria bacterium]|nr:hypothetical protein [Actinomycetota bacterium]